MHAPYYLNLQNSTGPKHIPHWPKTCRSFVNYNIIVCIVLVKFVTIILQCTESKM